MEWKLLFVLVIFSISAYGSLDTSKMKCCVSSDVGCKQTAVDEIAEHNKGRRQNSRVATGFIFLFVCIGYLCLTCSVAILLGWISSPFTPLFLKCKKEIDEKHRTMYNTQAYLGVLVAIVIILTAAGLTGWMILGFIFIVADICIGVVLLLANRRSGRVASDADVNKSKPSNDASWSHYPSKLGKHQTRICISMAAGMLFFLVLILIVFYAWKPRGYYLWDYTTKCQAEESIPPTTGKALALMYSFEGWATNIRAGVYTKITTSYCGQQFTKKLSSDADKEKRIFKAFVDLYKINMSIYLPPDWKSYDTVNEWFIRKVDALKYRPISSVAVESQVVSPADCRMLIFPILESSFSVWVKGNTFSVAELLAVPSSDPLATAFTGGTMVIARLAPQDYHRFNTPVAGQITFQKSVQGTYWSVGADAATSNNKAFYNLRQIMTIDGPKVGKVAYVAIGATCVGSVVVGKKVGDILSLGDELGFMQFGGSTVILLFQPGKFLPNTEIFEYSKIPVESYVQVNMQIGSINAP